jgi:hypothetical protein
MGAGGDNGSRRKQRGVVSGIKSSRKEVLASIIQGSRIGPTLAKIFSNTSHSQGRERGRHAIREEAGKTTRLRARNVTTKEQQEQMQEDIWYMLAWCLSMDVLLNQDKVHVLHQSATNPPVKYMLWPGGPVIKEVGKKKDLGVIESADLKSIKMVARQTGRAHLKTYKFLKTFICRGSMWIDMYKTFMRPRMLHASTAWRPTNQEELRTLE